MGGKWPFSVEAPLRGGFDETSEPPRDSEVLPSMLDDEDDHKGRNHPDREPEPPARRIPRSIERDRREAEEDSGQHGSPGSSQQQPHAVVIALSPPGRRPRYARKRDGAAQDRRQRYEEPSARGQDSDGQGGNAHRPTSQDEGDGRLQENSARQQDSLDILRRYGAAL